MPKQTIPPNSAPAGITQSAEDHALAREINRISAEINKLQHWYTEHRRQRGLKPGDPDPLLPKLGRK